MARIPRPKAGSLVLVTWEDIQTEHGWDDPHTAPGLAVCTSVGYVVQAPARSRSLTLAATHGRDGSHVETVQRISIPWGCVRQVQALGVVG